MRGSTYLHGELSLLRPVLPRLAPGKRHVYCSPHNAGATVSALPTKPCRRVLSSLVRLDRQALPRELDAALGVEVVFTCEATELAACERMLVYLNGLTWTSGAESESFASDVMRAVDANVPLLLVHEMAGAVGTVEERHSVDFATFFACDRGATPNELLQRGIYSSIAIALKGGAWRQVGMVMVAQGLGGRVKRTDACTALVECLKRCCRSRAKPILREVEVNEQGLDTLVLPAQLPTLERRTSTISLSRRSSRSSWRYEKFNDENAVELATSSTPSLDAQLEMHADAP